jgi:putative tributyrin esterase
LCIAFVLTAGCSRAGVARSPLISASPSVAPRVFEESFFSEALGVQKHALVYLPPSYWRDTTRRYPVAYYLHGLGGAEGDWVAKGSIDVAADSLFATGTSEMIIVMPDGDDGWYTTWVHQISFRSCADTLHVESPDRYCVERERYDDYVAHDVVRFVDSRYRTLADREHRGVGGLSMGGYGALSLALHYPDVFAAAASHSGVLSPMYVGPHPFVAPPRYATTPEEIRPTTGFFQRYSSFWGSDLARWREADVGQSAELLLRRKSVMPAMFIDCGSDDGFVDQNRALHWELTRLGVTHEYAEWPGAHTWRYWSTHVRKSLSWLSQRIAQ